MTGTKTTKPAFIRFSARTSVLTGGAAALALAAAAFAVDVVAVYDVPDNTSGLAWDGERIWMGGVGENADLIFAWSPDRQRVTDTLRAPASDCFGLCWFRDRLAFLSPHRDSTYFIIPHGQVSRIANPYPNMSGLAAADQALWSTSFYDPGRTLLRMDESGRILESLPYSGRHCRDLTFHNGLLFAADRYSHEIRVINPATGRLANAIPTPETDPAGVTSDGRYVWVLDDGEKAGSNRLYKFLVREAGGMRLSEVSHNFGSVVVDGERVWRLWIYNDGDRAAELVRLESRDGNEDIFIPHVWQNFQTVGPGDSAFLDFTFRPASADSAHIYYGLTYDLDRATNWVYLAGRGVSRGRNLSVLDRQLQFQQARTGDFVRLSNLKFLRIDNVGGEPLTIREIRSSNPAFFTGFYHFPHTFEEPGLYYIPVFFRPSHRGVISGVLTVFSDDPDNGEAFVSVSGRADDDDYPGGAIIWDTRTGNPDAAAPAVRGFQDIEDITGDGLADVVLATNDYRVIAYHAASNFDGTAVWTYSTNANPWRNGRVVGSDALSEGADWDGDGVNDVVVGLAENAMSVVALSGRLGKEIWTFDTHSDERGGGEIRAVSGLWDFTGDRIRDVLAACAGPDGSHATHAVFLFDGQARRLVWMTYFEARPRYMRVVRDYTGDNYRDLFVLLEDGTLAGVDGRRGNIIWSQQVAGDLRALVAIDDVNGDGSMDVAVVTNLNGITMFNGSNGTNIWYRPAGQPDFNVRDLTCGIALNDLNGNGSPDLVVGDAVRYVWALDGRTAELAWYDPFLVGSKVLSLSALGDLDHDGRRDFVCGTEEGRFFCLKGAGLRGLWSYGNVGPGHGFVTALGTRDLDGNGNMDVMAAMSDGTVFCFAGTWVGDTLVAVRDDFSAGALPQAFTVAPAFPNPFNGAVCLPVRLNAPGAVVLSVRDLMGREFRRVDYGELQPGAHTLVWDAGGTVPSGVYFLEVQAGGQTGRRAVQYVR